MLLSRQTNMRHARSDKMYIYIYIYIYVYMRALSLSLSLSLILSVRTRVFLVFIVKIFFGLHLWAIFVSLRLKNNSFPARCDITYA